MNKNFIIFALFALVFASCDTNKNNSNSEHSHSKETVKSYYTCSMHPQIKQDKPGKCPICHMNLTKVEVDDSDEEAPATMAVPEKDIWQCQNFPDVTSEKEDVCPIDGTPMVLKPKENKAGKVIGKVKLRKSQLSHFKPEYFPTTTMMMSKKIRLLGTVLQSEDKESNIPARIGGRVEKVYIEYDNNHNNDYPNDYNHSWRHLWRYFYPY